MDDDKKEKGWLSGTFKKVLYWGTIGLALTVTGNIFWQMFLDPLFFPVIHDVTNVVAQSWIAFINDSFGFIMDWIGFTGDGGLLQTDFMEAILSPFAEQVAVPTESELGNVVAAQGNEAVSIPSAEEAQSTVDNLFSLD